MSADQNPIEVSVYLKQSEVMSYQEKLKHIRQSIFKYEVLNFILTFHF